MDDVRAGRAAGFPGLAEWLRGPECERLVRDRGNDARALFRDLVAKRTGRLASEVEVTTALGGARGDRYEATVTAKAPYAAAHEFGTADRGRQNAAHTFRDVLAALGGAS